MEKKIPIEISARHIHLSQKNLGILFGENYQLKKFKDLTEPPEFAAQETLDIFYNGKRFSGVRIIGPPREETQVELSLTDAINLGLNPPIKVSGDLEGTPGLVLIGPRGEVELRKGVIIAWRHIHCNPQEAEKLGFKDRIMVSVKCGGDRGLTFHNVVIRIGEGDRLCMHLDTDEGNAAGINKKGKGEILL